MNDDTRNMRQTHPAHRAAGDGPTPPDPTSTDRRAVPDDDGHVPVEKIAAWLDTPDDFDASERTAIAAHVAGCPDCRQVVSDLRGIVASLASLPEAAAPRSFSLTREMIADPVTQKEGRQRAPVQMRQTTAWYERQMRAIRWATAVAAVLFVFVLSVDLVTNRIDPNRAADNAPIAAQSEPANGGSAAGGAAADEMPPDSGGDNTTSDERHAEEAELADEPENAEDSDDAAMAVQESEESEESAPESGTTPASAEDTAAEEESAGETADTTLAVKDPNADEEAADAGAETFSTTSLSDEQVIDESSERLRIIQVGLALILVWLLAAMIALPRMRRR